MILKQVTGFVRMLVVNPAEEANKRKEDTLMEIFDLCPDKGKKNYFSKK